MNIDKAIKIKEEMHSLGLAPYDEKSIEADQLSIEGLKRLKQNRTLHFIPSLKLLPGETKD